MGGRSRSWGCGGAVGLLSRSSTTGILFDDVPPLVDDRLGEFGDLWVRILTLFADGDTDLGSSNQFFGGIEVPLESFEDLLDFLIVGVRHRTDELFLERVHRFEDRSVRLTCRHDRGVVWCVSLDFLWGRGWWW